MKNIICLLLVLNLTTSAIASCEDDAYSSYEYAENLAYTEHSLNMLDASFWDSYWAQRSFDNALSSALASLTGSLAICNQGMALKKDLTL